MIKFLIYLTAVIATVSAQENMQGDVRLVNGSSAYDGTLQVWNANEWRYVCDDGFGMSESIVVCRQMGYYPPNPLTPICCQRVDPPRYWLDNVQCRGTESRISQCRHRGWGNHNCGVAEGVRVRCVFRNPCASNPCPSGSTCSRISNIRYQCDTPVEPKSPPGYRVSVQGVFQTEDRSIITAECTAAYAREMELKAFQQVDRINERIGNTLCRGLSGFEVVVVGTSVSTSQNRGIVNLDFIKTGQGSSLYNHYYSCSADVSAYVRDFNNWQLPMLPTPPGCPAVRFYSNVYRETGRDWFC